jgi:nucleotide-binding universal stress UspA family protein
MTYPSILVPLDHQPACIARTQAVLALARTMGSHVTGVAPTDVLDLRAKLGLGSTVAALPLLARDVLLEDAARAALAFDVACELAGVSERRTMVEDSDMSTALNRRGRVNDLLVLTQSDPRANDGRAFKNPQIETTILASARPVLVLPYANAAGTLGTRVLVAWDDSHAAARAIADALPLLRRAEAVHVMLFNRDAPEDEGGLSSDLSSVAQWLARHGVIARTRVETTTIEVGDALLSRAADLGVDLIVMGAFGHARWRERILGGTTRDVLGTMTVPVLMSH